MNKNSHDTPVRFALSFALLSVVLAMLAAVMILVSVLVYEHTEARDTASSIASAAAPDKLPTVVIDAGHGGEDGGAVGKNGVLEKDLNLQIANMLCDMLRASGVNAVMTRTEDILLYDRNVDYMGRKKSLDLKARLEMARNVPEPLLISIHMNAFPSEKYSGLQVWYSKNDGGSRALAEMIQNGVREKLQPENDREIKQANSSIYLLDRAAFPAVLVECGFLSNAEECERLSSEGYRRLLAFTLFSVINDYIRG